MPFFFRFPLYPLVLCLLVLFGCTSEQNPLFKPLPSSQTGIDFANTISEDDSLLNPLDYDYVYNGGGVAVGDVTGNNRPDLYFAGNTVDNRLYLNGGALQFTDVTARAGVAAEGAWSTGVSFVDINQDGLQDIYVCVGGPPGLQKSRANKLYVNQGLGSNGVPTFEERASNYGVADSSYSTHAAFLDYDRDGDLDLYVLNNAVQDRGQTSITPKQTNGQAPSTDQLYRNDGTPESSAEEKLHFTNVSEEAGIQIEGSGLGVAVTDINKDGWPDVYAANDFLSNDLLYINNGDGTFTNRIDRYLKHQSYSAMGVDVADFNNDTWSDVMVLDMLPSENARNKIMSRFFDRESFRRSLRLGYEPQYVRNTLQLNNGRRPHGPPVFSEIAHLAGVESTDWSWAPLLADFDNDGDRDLFVTNGYGKDVTNLDFARKYRQITAFGSPESNQEEISQALQELPRVPLSNRFFENEGDLAFASRTGSWAPTSPTISNGAAFGDLDRDGDLDLAVNNINQTATLLENRARGSASASDSAHALRVRLRGPDGNRAGLGAKLLLKGGSATQYHEHSTYRGYQSTVEGVVHFGLGADSTAEALEVRWPDGRRQRLTDLKAGQVIEVRHEEASPDSSSPESFSPESSSTENWTFENSSSDSLLFEAVAEERGLSHRHREQGGRDFEQTPLLPHRFSQNGPGLAVGDVDGNGLDDVFVGADPQRNRHIFLQVEEGRFQEETLSMDTRFEDMGALFFDADGDGDSDLYVVSGGNTGSSQSDIYQDRLYLGSGDGSFRPAPEGALPEIRASGSVVTAADYDEDGDLDLFVGGRVRPGKYPLPPRSYLLRNDSEDGTVRFTDVTEEVAPAVAEAGLVSDALWTDYDGDRDRDLMVAGEWMPLSVFKNEGADPNGADSEGRRFVEATEEAGLEGTSGWWNGLAAGDFDRDGDPDYVAGNLGLNTRYEASPEEPVRVHAKDFDQNGSLDPVISHYVKGMHYPIHRRDQMIEQIPGLKTRFPSYQDYAEATFEDLFTEEEMEGAYRAKAVRFATSYLENRGDGTIEVRALPREVQTAPVFGMRSGDYDGDGHMDLLMVGNWYAPTLRTGRADAFVGMYLKGNGSGRFAPITGTESGFFVDGDAKALAEVATGENASVVVATQNDGPLKAFRYAPRGHRHVKLHPDDRRAMLTFEDGSIQKKELFYGSTYLSQSSRTLRIPSRVSDVQIFDSEGNQRSMPVDKLLPTAKATE